MEKKAVTVKLSQDTLDKLKKIAAHYRLPMHRNLGHTITLVVDDMMKFIDNLPESMHLTMKKGE